MRSFENDVLLGFADALTANENAEVPLWAELDADGNARTGEPPEGAVLVILDVAPEGVDSVTLADYVVEDDPSLSDSVIGVQVRIACVDRDRLRGIRSDIFALFHGRWGGMLGRVELVTSSRSSGTNGGQEASERIVRTDNYYLTVHRPSTHRQ